MTGVGRSVWNPVASKVGSVPVGSIGQDWREIGGEHMLQSLRAQLQNLSLIRDAAIYITSGRIVNTFGGSLT